MQSLLTSGETVFGSRAESYDGEYIRKCNATPGCDRERAGRFFACHAEKQLVAYLLNKHTFFNDEILEGACHGIQYQADRGSCPNL